MLERTQNTCNIITIQQPGRYFQPPHPLSPSTMLHPTIISIFWGRKPWQIHPEEKHVFLLYKHLSDILRGKLIPCQNCNFFCCRIFLHPSLLSIIIQQWRCDISDRSSLEKYFSVEFTGQYLWPIPYPPYLCVRRCIIDSLLAPCITGAHLALLRAIWTTTTIPGLAPIKQIIITIAWSVKLVFVLLNEHQQWLLRMWQSKYIPLL